MTIKSYIESCIKTIIFRLIMLACPVKKNKIVFANFGGKRYGDSPKDIADEIIKQKLDYELIWLMGPGFNADLPKEIKRKSFRFFSQSYQLATAKVWVDSHTKLEYVSKKRNQFYIETWHGSIALKKIEGDAAEAFSKVYMKRSRHNTKLADVFISNSKFCTDMYRRAFGYKGEIAEYGCPKNDIFFGGHELYKSKVNEHFKIRNKKIALYAPTFRVDGKLDSYKLDYEKLIAALTKRLGGDWVVLVRLHPMVMRKAEGFINYNDVVINATGYDNMQELLVASDVLITDYSSCMFEFSIQKKPCFLFATDYADYMDDRGMYFDYFDLPYPVAENNEQMEKNIADFSEERYVDKLNSFFDEIGLKEDGNASKRVVERIKKVIGEK